MSALSIQCFIFSFILMVLVASKDARAQVTVNWAQATGDPITGYGSVHGTPSMVYSTVSSFVYVGFTTYYIPASPPPSPSSNLLWVQCAVTSNSCTNFRGVNSAASYSPPSLVSWNVGGESDVMFYINGLASPVDVEYKYLNLAIAPTTSGNATDLDSLKESSVDPSSVRPPTVQSMFESSRNKLRHPRRHNSRSLLNKENGHEPVFSDGGPSSGSLTSISGDDITIPNFSNAPGPRAAVLGGSVYVFIVNAADSSIYVKSALLDIPGATLTFGNWAPVMYGDTPLYTDAGDFDVIVVPGASASIPAEMFIIYGVLDKGVANIFYVSSIDAVTWTSPPSVPIGTSPSVSSPIVTIETWGVTGTSYMFAGFCPTVLIFYPQATDDTTPAPSVENSLVSIQLQNVEESGLVAVGSTTPTPIFSKTSGSGYAFTSGSTVYIWLLYQNPATFFMLRTFGTIVF